VAEKDARLQELLSLMFQAHPWHGVAPTDDGNLETIRVFVEIVPTDAVKYELSKRFGQLRLDRPQRFSSLPPTLYGLIPQTFCGDEFAELCRARTGISEIEGDGDPLDICVLSEKTFSHGGFFVQAVPIGGIRIIDGSQADDKIIAVLQNDIAYGQINDIWQVPRGLIERLQHYFSTYKQPPQSAPRRVEIAGLYDHTEALDVITRTLNDYRRKYGAPENRIGELRKLLAWEESQVSSSKSQV
jgi:inorganic pyrophosphatase